MEKTINMRKNFHINLNNDWLIKGFSAYLEISKKNPILILLNTELIIKIQSH